MILNQRLVVVMPAYNAAKTLEKTYREIPREYVDEVILVDDASQDETIAHARRLGLTVEVHKEKLAGARMTQAGMLVIEAKRYRTQEQNRADALLRLAVLIEKASHRPRVRHATQPSLTARIKRVETKKKRGAVKKLRQPSSEE